MNQRTSGADDRPRRSPAGVAPVLAACLLALFPARPACAQQITVDPHLYIPIAREFTIALAIDTGGRAVVGLEVEVSFDPGTLELVGVDPGEWVTGSGLDHFFHDHTAAGAATIHLTMAFLGGGASGAGRLAVCRFQALAEGDCPLEFVRLDVRDAGNVDLGFGHSTGDLVIIETAIPVAEITWSGVKGQFRR